MIVQEEVFETRFGWLDGSSRKSKKRNEARVPLLMPAHTPNGTRYETVSNPSDRFCIESPLSTTTTRQSVLTMMQIAETKKNGK